MLYKLFTYFLVLFVLSNRAAGQAIHSILVPGTTKATLTQALDQFYTFSNSYDLLTETESDLESRFSITIGWPEQMLCWDINSWSLSYSQYAKWTAFAVIAYAKAYRYETNPTRKSSYEIKAKKGAEFLLWLQSYSDAGGALVSGLADTPIPGHPEYTERTYINSFNSGDGGAALVECYRSFGDQKYYDAAEDICDFLVANPMYLGQWPNAPEDYYGNINHQARPLFALAEFYKISGDQKYLDAAIGMAEEIIAWQDYIHNLDPWGESTTQGDWDGSWYWQCGGPDPLVPGSITPPFSNALAADRRTGYHTDTMNGLIKLFEAVEQHRLAGTVTERNNNSYQTFRASLIYSIIKGLNFVIDNQETSSGTGRYNGMVRDFKNYKKYGSDVTFDGYSYNSTPTGLETMVDAYKLLLESGELTTTDSNRLQSFINKISSAMVGKYTNSLVDHNAWRCSMMVNWASYIEHESLGTPIEGFQLKNPSFEDDNIVWELWSWDSIKPEIVSNNARTGSKALHIVDNSTNSGKWACMLVSVEPNTQYTLEAYAKVVSGASSMYQIYYTEDLTEISQQYVIVNQSSNYQKVTLTRTTPSNASYVAVWFHAPWYGTSETYWDDVTFVKVLSKKNPSSTIENDLIDNYSMENYPNPFNPSTNIMYQLKEQGLVTIKVYDILGKEITTLVNEIKPSGSYEIKFDASNLASGIYVYTMKVNDFSTSKKMFLVK